MDEEPKKRFSFCPYCGKRLMALIHDGLCFCTECRSCWDLENMFVLEEIITSRLLGEGLNEYLNKTKKASH